MSIDENSMLVEEVLHPLLARAISFISGDLGIDVLADTTEILSPTSVNLKTNTAMIGTGGAIQVMITMGYDDKLLEKIVEAFLEGEEADEDEMDEIRESVSCEVINTIVGNALRNPVDDTTLSITPPIAIYEAKSLFKHKSSKIATATLKTEYGDMLLTAIGPRANYEKELNFKEL